MSERISGEKRMTCLRCPRYNRSELRCLDGKSNPRSKVDTVAVVETLGIQALCYHNAYRDQLVMRIYFPTAPATLAATARYRDLRSRRARLAARQRGLSIDGSQEQ